MLKPGIIHSPFVSQIIIHGPEDATDALGDFCGTSEELFLDSLRCPHAGETVNVALETNIYRVCTFVIRLELQL